MTLLVRRVVLPPTNSLNIPHNMARIQIVQDGIQIRACIFLDLQTRLCLHISYRDLGKLVGTVSE